MGDYELQEAAAAPAAPAAKPTHEFQTDTATPSRRKMVVISTVVIVTALTIIIALSVVYGRRGSDVTTKCKILPSKNIAKPLPTEMAKALMERVSVRISKNSCDAVFVRSADEGGACEDDGYTFYREYITKVNGTEKRVIVASGIPDHPAEQDPLSFKSPFRRCTCWRFSMLPVNVSRITGKGKRTAMMAVGQAVTGGVFFSDLSKPPSSLAVYDEADNLDSCFGHAAPDRQYHYHANINCTTTGRAKGSNDPNACAHIGYLFDGVPVYGLCQKNGTLMTSCYRVKAGITEQMIDHVNGNVSVANSSTSYEYSQSSYDNGDCNLDDGNGAIHPDSGLYSYFMTTSYPFVPIYYNGEFGEGQRCSAAANTTYTSSGRGPGPPPNNG